MSDIEQVQEQMKTYTETMEEQMTTMMEAMMSMNKLMKELCEDFKIRRYNLTPYRPKMNGAIEAHNKNIKKIIQKMTVANKDWHEMLSFVLHDIELLCELLLGQPCLHWCMRWKLSSMVSV